MSIHRSAKTHVYQRQLLIQRVRTDGWTQRAAAAAAGVSSRTVAKWLARAATSLTDRSSRSHRQPRRTPLVRELAIVALRRQRATAWQISQQLGMARSTVTRILRRVGLARLAALEPVAPARRYEWAAAGDLLHVDIKPLGRIRGVGHRIHGDRAQRARGAGYEYVHVAVDDATRLAFVEVHRSQQQEACATFLRRAVAWFRRRGIRIRRVLTDNGPAYKSHAVAAVCRLWALRHRFTRPYRPQTNGKAERFIQTLLREWAYRAPYASSAARTRALGTYVRFYNHWRPHASLGRRTPWIRFQEAV